MATGRVEQQRRRGQPWRRWKETAISPLPRYNWIDGELQRVFVVASAHDDGDARSGMADGCGLGAACGEGEREANGAGGAFGQALALFWSADARRGGFGSAWAPRGEQLLRRSAMATLTIF